MEFESSTLAIESFSDTWLTSAGPFLDDVGEPFTPSIDNFHGGVSSRKSERRIRNPKTYQEDYTQNFNFDVPKSTSPPDVLVHADQIFSDGLIKPIFMSQSKLDACNSSSTSPTFYSPPFSSKSVVTVVDVQCHMLGRWRKSSEKVLKKCFGYFRPICYRVVNGSKRSRRVDDIDRRSLEINSWCSSVQATPRRSAGYLQNDWSDSESSIYEAVLHCKRSINW